MNLQDLLEMKALYGFYSKNKKSVTKSYSKGRRVRVQQIITRHNDRPCVKQIIHYAY